MTIPGGITLIQPNCMFCSKAPWDKESAWCESCGQKHMETLTSDLRRARELADNRGRLASELRRQLRVLKND